MDTMPGSRSHRNPSCQAAIRASSPGSAKGGRSSPGTPSAENMRRSIPAQNEGPAPRTTTTRTRDGRSEPIAASPCQTAGVIALRRSGLLSVTVATASVMSRRSPPASSCAVLMVTAAFPGAAAGMMRPCGGPGGGPAAAASGMAGACPGSALSLTAGRAAAAAQRHPGLGQDPVDEAVGPAGRAGQGPDALPRVVSLLEVSRQLRAVGTRHPGAFLEGLGHEYLPVS